MRLQQIKLILKSLLFYRKQVLNQFAVIFILALVISGSLLTGFSVRSSLKDTATEKLGNTGFLISSGLRYFDESVAGKLSGATGVKCISVLETEARIQKFDTGNYRETARVFGISNNFFHFHGTSLKYIGPGEAALNETAASRLKLKPGDEFILTQKQISDLPANSPFAPSVGDITSYVFRVRYILKNSEKGNFSLTISQTDRSTVFVNLTDISKTGRANRLLVDYRYNTDQDDLNSKLKSILTPDDIGLRVRNNVPSGSAEIISSRIFFDDNLINNIRDIIPEASPLITYLINGTLSKKGFNPYSFASGVPESIYPEIPDGRKILVNRWLAGDIGVTAGDTVKLSWYEPERINDLVEREEKFVVAGVVELEGKWDDPDLMPEFPGITGQVSCSRWDAGVKLKTELIRKEDEEYWNIYQGTPKIFMSYETGKELWGNNFGPATAIRVPSENDRMHVFMTLTGNIDPSAAGFRIVNIRNDMLNAASRSVDFSTLFLGLGIFIIISSLMLLALSVSSFLERRREEIFTLFAIGYSNRNIFFLLITENIIIAALAALAGATAGIFFNFIVIKALNSVWSGAVNTSSLSHYTGIVPLTAGFLITVSVSVIIQYLRIRKYLKEMARKESRVFRIPGKEEKVLRILLVILIIPALVILFIVGMIKGISVPVSYLSGGLIFTGFILTLRYLLNILPASLKENETLHLSLRYYRMYPSRAVLPVLLIASGLFAVIATGVNRLEITRQSLSTSGGTGGFLLWAETAVPIKENLNSSEGRKKHGLLYPPSETMKFMQAKRLPGDDASCLNLNHVTSPPVLGVDNNFLKESKAFSFETLIDNAARESPWSLLDSMPAKNTIYGFADQTVLQWGLKKSVGDTLVYVTENGDRLNIIIAGGIKSSLFQGYLLTGECLFSEYFPSVPGASVILVSGRKDYTDKYITLLNARFENYGIEVIDAKEKLSAFFTVTNTYLSVFMVLGAFGMVLGVIGLGFVLMQNYRFRRREFGLMIALGYNQKSIKKAVISEQVLILVYGLVTGFAGALSATMPLAGNIRGIPWISVILIIASILTAGLTAIFLSLRSIRREPLLASLRRE